VVLFLELVGAVKRVTHGFLLAVLNFILIFHVPMDLDERLFLLIDAFATARFLFFYLITHLGKMLI
jgi:hypothetical protein